MYVKKSNIFINTKKFFEGYRNNPYLQAVYFSILAFSFIRIFTSLVLLAGFFKPSFVVPTLKSESLYLFDLEQHSLISRLFLAPWYRWDTTSYLEISDFGYNFDLSNTIWPPLYPFFIKIVSNIFQPSLFAAIVVSNFFFIAALFLLFTLVKDSFDETLAKNTLLYLVVFPASFYFVAAYSESLFLALSLAVFLTLNKKKWMLAGFISALGALTRVQGVLLSIPILIELIKNYQKDHQLKHLLRNLFSCLLGPFAYTLYSLYVYYGLRTEWPWITLTRIWDQHYGMPWEGVYYTFLSIIGKNDFIDYSPNIVKILNILISFLAIFILIKIRKKLPSSVLVYSWVMLILILGKLDYNNTFVGTMRYVLLIFPFFIGLAANITNKYVKLTYISINLILQSVLLMFFYWWIWVA